MEKSKAEDIVSTLNGMGLQAIAENVD